MKILHIETGRHLYGGALQVFYLMQGLQRHGISNLLVCSRGSEIGRRSREIAEVIELPLAGDVDPRLFLGLYRTIRQQAPDLLHAHSRRGADWWGGVTAKLCGIPAVLTRRVDNAESPLLVKLKYGRYDRVVTISDGIRQVLLKEGVPADKLQLIHSVVDHQRYGQPADRAWLQHEFALAPEAKTVAVIAQLIERKGHRFLLEAAGDILAVVPETRFIFFGQGPLRSQLEMLCRSLGLADKVIFAGFRDDLARILPCLDLVVHPALMEGLGVSLLQTAAAGVPMVGARAGGIPEIVRDGENGFLVPPGEVQPLRDRTLQLLTDQKLAQQFGAAGRRIVVEDFSIDTMVKRYLDLYAQLCR